MLSNIHFPVLKDDNATMISYIIIVAIFFIIIWMIYYAIRLNGLQGRECSYMNQLYPKINGAIKPINKNDPLCAGKLYDYFIKTAYNACSGGDYSYDYVDICNLKSILSTGTRCLDFALYSIDDNPVVATSINDDYYTKETFNSVPFADVMKTIKDYAFATGTAPNNTDPIIVHLRIRSNNHKMYSKLIEIFQAYASIMLGNAFSYESGGHNLGEVPLLAFMNKVIIIVDKHDQSFLQHDELLEYVNLTSSSDYMRVYRFSDMENNADVNELTFFNKRAMTMVMPDEKSNPSNPTGILCRETGCQMVAMRSQYNDRNLKDEIDFFNKCGYAFCLKPAELRDSVINIEAKK
jgi:hypothetical protein